MNIEDPLIVRAREKAIHLVELTESFVMAASAAQQAINKHSDDLQDKLEEALTQFELVENTVNVLQTLHPLIMDHQQQLSIKSSTNNASLSCRRSLSRLHRALSAVQTPRTEIEMYLRQLDDILVEVKQEDDLGSVSRIKTETVQSPSDGGAYNVHNMAGSTVPPAMQQDSTMDVLNASFDSQRLSSPVPQQVINSTPSNVAAPSFLLKEEKQMPLQQTPPLKETSPLRQSSSLQETVFLPHQLSSTPFVEQRSSQLLSTILQQPASSNEFFDPMDVSPTPSVISAVPEPAVQQHRLQPHETDHEMKISPERYLQPPSVVTSHFLDQFEATAKVFAEKTGYTLQDVWEKMLVYALPSEEHRVWANSNIFNKNLTWQEAKDLYKRAFPDPDPFSTAPPTPPLLPPHTPLSAEAATTVSVKSESENSLPKKKSFATSLLRPEVVESKLKQSPSGPIKSKNSKPDTNHDRARSVQAKQYRMQRFAECLFELRMGDYDSIQEYNRKYVRYCRAAEMDCRDPSLVRRYISSLLPPYRKAIKEKLQRSNDHPPSDIFGYVELTTDIGKHLYSPIASEKIIISRAVNCQDLFYRQQTTQAEGQSAKRKASNELEDDFAKRRYF
ncbi:hypothetical protein BDF20DRAFT_866050 [Mycotypha africana]|uniref:uncharacterized protein n=1 Tax=Mycotypha africana TaxID=64632 RepID=UPI002300EEF9|nr:uncharacterized protein BDF20DRAFT_866050 [Mycotypha africana]KAI8982290.1 hypothetical protein BDF20DRAFT_866050 [Mycotypha africana]